MIQMGTVLDVADNSGARKIACIHLRGGSSGQYGGLGDVITASVKEATPEGTVKKGQVVRAVIVRTRRSHRRRDGSHIRFDTNSAVLVNEAGEPIPGSYHPVESNPQRIIADGLMAIVNGTYGIQAEDGKISVITLASCMGRSMSLFSCW